MPLRAAVPMTDLTAAKRSAPQPERKPPVMVWTASPQRHHSAKAWSQQRHKEGDRP
jgi:hypothetical protein